MPARIDARSAMERLPIGTRITEYDRMYEAGRQHRIYGFYTKNQEGRWVFFEQRRDGSSESAGRASGWPSADFGEEYRFTVLRYGFQDDHFPTPYTSVS